MRKKTFHNRRHRGLGLVELLTCLGISSLLLTATGAAYYASFNSYRDNMARGAMLSAGRSALTAIVRDIRMSEVHAPYDTNSSTNTAEQTQFTSGNVAGTPNSGLPSAGGSGTLGIQMIKQHVDTLDTVAPVTITYWYDSANMQLKTSRQIGAGTVTTQVICSGVQGFRTYIQPVYMPFNPDLPTIPPAWGLQQAVIVLTLSNQDANGNPVYPGGKQVTLTLTEAAAPRRNFGTH